MGRPRYISRRTFLKGAGGLAISLPMLDIMRGGLLYGQSASSPPKFMIIHQAWGWGPQWEPTMTGNALNLTGNTFAALEAYKSKMLYVKGMRADTPEIEHGSLFSPVFSGTIGTHQGINAFTMGGPSIDQVIANKIGSTTLYRSIELQASFNPDFDPQSISWKSANEMLPRDKDPFFALNKIFQNVQTGGGGPSPAALAEITRGKSILDGVQSDLNRLKTMLSSADKKRVDIHLTSIREIEKRMETIPPACAKPTFPALPQQLVLDTYLKRIQSMNDLAAAALACDLTRVVSLQLDYREVDVGFGIHHNLGHDSAGTDPAKHAARFETEKWYAQRLKELLDKMASYQLLDNTIVILLSSMAEGNHQVAPHKVLMIGNVNNYFKANQFINLPDQPNMNRFMLSVMRAYGIQDTNFGLPDRCVGGPIASLKA